jgi:N utilization substance protein B
MSRSRTDTDGRGLRHSAGRRLARELAMQALFELELAHHAPEQALEDRLAERPLAPHLAAFTRELVVGVWQQRTALDERIATAAPQWPLHQLPAVEKSILRLAIYELIFDNKTPPRAAINEAVELAKAYGGEHSSRFVNGVLGAIASELNDRGGEVHGGVNVRSPEEDRGGAAWR